MVRYSEAPALGTFSPKQAELLSKKKKKTELLALQEANRASKFVFSTGSSSYQAIVETGCLPTRQTITTFSQDNDLSSSV